MSFSIVVSLRRTAFALATTAIALFTGSATAAPCLEDAFGGTVNCAANDVSIASVSVTQVTEACDGEPGDTFTFNGALNVEQVAVVRYDIGFYLGADPQSSNDADCFVGIINPALSDEDGDQCGDIGSPGLLQVPATGVTVPCQDSNADGFYDFNSCTSWKQAPEPDCNGPEDALPSTSSKCNCEVVDTDLEVVLPQADFVVNTTADTSDASAGNGVCADSGGFCSLRAAIQESNALAGNNSIALPSGIYAVTSSLVLSSDISLTGTGSSGSMIDGADVTRPLRITAGTSEIRGVTIRNGFFDAVDGNFAAGAVTVSAGATLTLEDAVVRDNVSLASGIGSALGGGVANFGTATLRRVLITNNEAMGGGGIRASTGSTTIIEESEIVDNHAVTAFSCGGGLSTNGVTTIRDTLIEGNTAGAENGCGGGIFNSSSLRVERSLFLDNGATASAALRNSDPGDAEIVNSTFSGNYRIGEGTVGSVISNDAFDAGPANLSLSNCTISGNGPLDRVINTQGSSALAATTTIRNSIIDNPGVAQCRLSGTNRSVVSGDYNIIADATCFSAMAHDLLNTASLLSPLADNGGFTKTFSLQPGSPALNAIPAASCETVGGADIGVDQRGAGRPAENLCERGAYEKNVCGDGVSGGPEQCDDGNALSGDCCSSSCEVESAATVCRPAAGVCDLPETCNGTGGTCPANLFAASSTTCRPAAGVCDLAETCTGSSATCPADILSSSLCRAAAGVCDVAELCTGTNAACPTDGFASGVCRTATGVCDIAESCSGSSASCPANGFVPTAVTCRVAMGICDVAERCSGTNAACPTDSVLASSTTCRASAGVCDASESCTGSTASCPADLFDAETTCRGSAGVCDIVETCNGSSASCPADSYVVSAVVCRAASGVCDLSELCSGSGASCPADALAGDTTVCRGAAGDCDVVETCNGSAASCPSDALKDEGSPCGDADESICDHADTCDGAGVCRINLADDGTLCDDVDTCTTDQCIEGVCESEPISGCPVVPDDAAVGNEFGRSVALTADYMVVGAPASLNDSSGRVHVFLATEDGYVPQTQSDPIDLPFHDDQLTGDLDFGAAVDADRDTIVVGAPFDVVPVGDKESSGSVTVFFRSGAVWTRQAKLLDESGLCTELGADVAISGNTIVAGAPGGDCALVFERSGSQWSKVGQLGGGAPDTRFGQAVDVSGLSILVGAPGQSNPAGCKDDGAVFAFRRNDEQWQLEDTLEEPAEGGGGACFGAAVGIDAAMAAIGAPFDDSAADDAGAVYVFDRVGSQFEPIGQLFAFPDPAEVDGFGASLDISVDTIIVGAPGVAAYVFQRSSGTEELTRATATLLSLRRYVPRGEVPPDESEFGSAVSILRDRSVVGAPADEPDGLPNAGAVYPGDSTPPPAVSCGDGQIGGEDECDDGDTDWIQGEFCNAGCELVSCGDTNDDGTVTAGDALFALRAAVGSRVCNLQVCDTDQSGKINTSDALRILKAAVGGAAGLDCPGPPAATELLRLRLVAVH